MAKCTRCGAKAGFMMSICPACELGRIDEIDQGTAEGERSTAETAGVRPISESAVPVPISTDALSFLTVISWAVAIISVIAGIVTLMNTPESGYLKDATGLRTIYLA